MSILERYLPPFRGLFFATPALPGIGGGDMGGGGDDGGAGGGDGAGDDGIADESVDEGGDEGAVEDEGVEETDDEGAGDEGAEDEVGGEDGSKGKGKTKPPVEDAIKRLAKTDKAASEVLRREHFQNQQYRNVGTLPEVQGMKDFMMLHGGEQEISGKIEQGDRFAVELDMVANGDPAIVTDIARESPEGLMKLGPSVLAEMERIDQKRYGAMMASPIAKLIKSTGAFQLMQNIRYCIQKGMQEDGMKAATELVDWVNQVEQLGESQRNAAPSDADKKFSERERGIQQKERDIYDGEVKTASVAKISEVLGKHMRPLIAQAKLKGVNLTQAQKQDFEKTVWDSAAAALTSDATYQRQLKAFFSKKAPASEIAEYRANRIQSIAQKIVQEAWQLKGWASRVRGGKPATGGGNPGTNGHVPMLARRPDPADIDWSKTTQLENMGDGKVGSATLKSGKKIRFRWDMD